MPAGLLIGLCAAAAGLAMIFSASGEKKNNKQKTTCRLFLPNQNHLSHFDFSESEEQPPKAPV